MTAQPEITQRDLRTRSKEITDAVQGGQAFTATRDGHRVGELIPLRRRRRFVPRAELATRIHGRICAAVVSTGRKPRRRVTDLMIAAVAAAEGLPLFTTDPDDFKGLDDLITIVPVTRPETRHDR
ncbi:hypothetical protein AB0M97_19035 [Streptomyces sp. NPDC051207]|uniref:hypothetical protein n=1 Tax=Streptomyces sp. NPDC051207 TaxID=3154641 RepID=UPI0034447264